VAPEDPAEQKQIIKKLMDMEGKAAVSSARVSEFGVLRYIERAKRKNEKARFSSLYELLGLC
jgi:hypothetical protein